MSINTIILSVYVQVLYTEYTLFNSYFINNVNVKC